VTSIQLEPFICDDALLSRATAVNAVRVATEPLTQVVDRSTANSS
jgi:hypothetical protein